jgi:tRNA-(ms[2]io[6]A)-hydroxylase
LPANFYFGVLDAALHQVAPHNSNVLLFHQKPSAAWLAKVRANLPALLVDHAHLERKAATSALNLEKFRLLHHRVHDLNAIAIEELQHFELVLGLLERRGIPFAEPQPSAWIKGLMRAIRTGVQHQVIDHLLCCALIEGRSCEKFQILAEALPEQDPELARFYAGLVESEGNHYATYLLMAREINEGETNARLDWFLGLEAELARQPSSLPILH